MDGDDALAAIYTAEYFLDLYGYTVETGETQAVLNISLDTCEFCRSLIEATDAIYSKNGWQVGGAFTRGEGAISRDRMHEKEIQVVFDATQESAQVFDASGKRISEYGSNEYDVGVNLTQTEGKWLISSVSGKPK